MFIFDAHLDLSMNALEWNRDLTRTIGEIRKREHGRTDMPDRGRGTVCLPELRRGNIGLVVATQIGRYAKPTHPLGGWHSPEQAWAMTQGQLAWYRAMEEGGEMAQVKDRAGLEKHLQLWQPNGAPVSDPARFSASGRAGSETGAPKPVGYILSLEGADSIIALKHLERSFEQGLRAVGPAHYGPGTYAFGTDSEGSIGSRGRELLNLCRGLRPHGRRTAFLRFRDLTDERLDFARAREETQRLGDDLATFRACSRPCPFRPGSATWPAACAPSTPPMPVPSICPMPGRR